MNVLKTAVRNYLEVPVNIQHDALLDAWVEAQLNKLPRGSKIIDVGAGEQKYKRFCTHLDYVSQDFCEYSGQGNEQGLQMGTWDTSKTDIVSDITSIPAEDEAFDAVLCTEVFEHIPDPPLALREIHRILKRGGVLILTAPFMSETHFAPYHYCSGFDKYWYEYHLPRVGFSSYEISPYGNMYSNLICSLNLALGRSSVSKRDRYKGYLLRKSLIKYALADNDSSEVACFGYNVVAKK